MPNRLTTAQPDAVEELIAVVAWCSVIRRLVRALVPAWPTMLLLDGN